MVFLEHIKYCLGTYKIKEEIKYSQGGERK